MLFNVQTRAQTRVAESARLGERASRERWASTRNWVGDISHAAGIRIQGFDSIEELPGAPHALAGVRTGSIQGFAGRVEILTWQSAVSEHGHRPASGTHAASVTPVLSLDSRNYGPAVL